MVRRQRTPNTRKWFTYGAAHGDGHCGDHGGNGDGDIVGDVVCDDDVGAVVSDGHGDHVGDGDAGDGEGPKAKAKAMMSAPVPPKSNLRCSLEAPMGRSTKAIANAPGS